MDTYTPKQIRKVMSNSENIRHISIVAHTNHGKTTIFSSLVEKAGIITNKQINDSKYSKTPEDEKEISAFIHPAASSLYYEYDIFEKGNKDAYLINLIDSPGYYNLSAEITTALRITDGALLVVDYNEGVCLETDNILRQAMREKVRPALMINKIDKQILQPKVNAEDLYKNFIRVIESVNGVISKHEQPDMSDLFLNPVKGNVAFGSGKECWAFTLATFARIYAKKFKVDIEILKEKLWGDNYYDPKSKKWFKSAVNEDSEFLKRGFCAFIMEPIIKLSRSIMDGNIEQMNKMLASLEISLSSEEAKLPGSTLLQLVMSRWINSADILLEMMVLHLPSPKVAQKYRYEYLYDGPRDDEVTVSCRDCDPKGPLIMYVSRFLPSSDQKQFLAFGRVFGGTISTGQQVRIMGPEYVPGKKQDLYEKSIGKTVMLIGKTFEAISDVPCGNLVGLVGIDKYLLKNGTISSNVNSCCFRNIKFAVEPLVRVSVEPTNPSDLPKLCEGLRKLVKSDPFVTVYTDLSGQYTFAGCSDLDVAYCVNELRSGYANCGIKVSDPFVTYKETVSTTSSQICLSKSPNKHTRLYMTAQPLADDLSNLIETGKFGPNDDAKRREKVLCDDFGWDKNDVQKIWAFGPDNQGPNVFVDMTKNVRDLNEIKVSLLMAFQWTTREGVLTGESMRSVRMNLVDALTPTDYRMRSPGTFHGKKGILCS